MEKFCFTLSLLLLLMNSVSAQVDLGDECPSVDVVPPKIQEFIKTMTAVSGSLYVDVFQLKVNMDGEGKLSIYFENGVPKILKLTYKNKSGIDVKQITFDELARGKSLDYENASVPGKAISFMKDTSFKSGDRYKFKLSFRTSVKPPKYETHRLELIADPSSPKVTTDQGTAKSMILAPGVHFFSWDGTFKRVEFR